MKHLITLTIATIALQIGVITVGIHETNDRTYQSGADSGAHDLCQELGFTPLPGGKCDVGE